MSTLEPRFEEPLVALCREHGIKFAGVFGSFARNEQTQESDLDLLVEFEKPIGLIELVRAEREISKSLGVDVDLVTEGALSPYIRETVLGDLKVIPDD